MNIVLLFISIVFIFSMLILAVKYFGEGGAYAWIAVASILAEIAVCKSVEFFGFTTNLGNVLFASNFLATDIIAELYDDKRAKKCVYVGMFFVVFYLIISQLMLAFIPSSEDLADPSMKALFSLAPRVCISSIVMLFIANICDIKLYSFISKKTGGKLMWLRNNVSTILCNGIENYAFAFMAFWGLYDFPVLISIATLSAVIETLIALCDTPFLYIAKKVIKVESKETI